MSSSMIQHVDLSLMTSRKKGAYFRLHWKEGWDSSLTLQMSTSFFLYDLIQNVLAKGVMTEADQLGRQVTTWMMDHGFELSEMDEATYPFNFWARYVCTSMVMNLENVQYTGQADIQVDVTDDEVEVDFIFKTQDFHNDKRYTKLPINSITMNQIQFQVNQ